MNAPIQPCEAWALIDTDNELDAAFVFPTEARARQLAAKEPGTRVIPVRVTAIDEATPAVGPRIVAHRGQAEMLL